MLIEDVKKKPVPHDFYINAPLPVGNPYVTNQFDSQQAASKANSPIVHVGSDTCARLLTRFWYWLVYRLSDHMTDCVYDWCFGKYND